MTQVLDPSSALSAPLATSPPAVEVVGDDEARFARGPRAYRVRGLARALSAESLKVTLRVSCGERLHIDTLDLYQARLRAAFAKAAAVELGESEATIAADLSALVLALEPVQEAAIRGVLSPVESALPALSEAEEAAGLALLRDPCLVERIVADVEAVGVVGEGSEKGRDTHNSSSVSRSDIRSLLYRMISLRFPVFHHRPKTSRARTNLPFGPKAPAVMSQLSVNATRRPFIHRCPSRSASAMRSCAEPAARCQPLPKAPTRAAQRAAR